MANDTTTPAEVIKAGDIVKYSVPTSDFETAYRFEVVDIYYDRNFIRLRHINSTLRFPGLEEIHITDVVKA